MAPLPLSPWTRRRTGITVLRHSLGSGDVYEVRLRMVVSEGDEHRKQTRESTAQLEVPCIVFGYVYVAVQRREVVQ